MSVPDRIREIESEIDAGIRALPIWKASREAVLEGLTHTYRDGIEVVFAKFLHAQTFDLPLDDLGFAFRMENRLRAGYLWALKWATEYCPDIGEPTTNGPTEELMDLLFLGATYETLVDALKYAQRDLITIAVNEASRTIEFYEGGAATPFDSYIIEHQQITTPTTTHVSLTEDCDQLTSRWTAGDYRRVATGLADRAAREENTICVDPPLLACVGKPEISIPQPTVVWLNRPGDAPDCYVFDDLTLPTIVSDQLKWKLVSLLDTPIVHLGNRFCGLSSDLKTIAVIDDYMLRLAARVDPDQYSKASTLRENRMITMCRSALEECTRPWSVAENVLYKDPPQEADIVATREDETLLLQLKSTLRPETPWEVYNRNEGLIEGIKHTRKLVDRVGAKHGFVVTNGYRGDYACWAQALAHSIPIATLRDVSAIASDPVAATAELERLAGVPRSAPQPPQGVPDREGTLMGWTLRFLDSRAPVEGHA